MVLAGWALKSFRPPALLTWSYGYALAIALRTSSGILRVSSCTE